jgi:hypothetical protein
MSKPPDYSRQARYYARQRAELKRLRAFEQAVMRERERKSNAQTNPRKLGGVQRDGPAP